MKPRITVWVFVLMFGFASVMTGQSPSTDEQRIRAVLSDWKARLERCKTVRYTIKGTGEKKGDYPLPAGMKRPPAPKEPASFPYDITIMIDLTTKRFRIEQTELAASKARNEWVPVTSLQVWNGKEIQTLAGRVPEDRRPEIPDAYITKGNLGRSFVESELLPVFAAHGIVGTIHAPLRIDRLPLGHEEDDFSVHGWVRHRGRESLILRTNPLAASSTVFDELWVDFGRQGALVRYTEFQGTNPGLRCDVESKETPHGWLPDQWTVAWTVGGGLLTVKKFTVQLIEVDFPVSDDNFTLPVRPGMLVESNEFSPAGKGLNTDRPATTVYQADEHGRLKVVSRPTGFVTEDGVQLPPAQPSRLGWYLAGGGVGGLVLSLMYFLIRRKARLAKSNDGINHSPQNEVHP